MSQKKSPSSSPQPLGPVVARAIEDGLLIERTAEGWSLRVKVAPRASRSGIQGVHDGRLKVSLTSPPVDGSANAELIKVMSKALGVPKKAISITSGQTSRLKTIVVQDT